MRRLWMQIEIPVGAVLRLVLPGMPNGWVARMKLICRKCGLECPSKTFEDVERLQRMTCGGGGTHRLVGVN